MYEWGPPAVWCLWFKTYSGGLTPACLPPCLLPPCDCLDGGCLMAEGVNDLHVFCRRAIGWPPCLLSYIYVIHFSAPGRRPAWPNGLSERADVGLLGSQRPLLLMQNLVIGKSGEDWPGCIKLELPAHQRRLIMVQEGGYRAR